VHPPATCPAAASSRATEAANARARPRSPLGRWIANGAALLHNAGQLLEQACRERPHGLGGNAMPTDESGTAGARLVRGLSCR